LLVRRRWKLKFDDCLSAFILLWMFVGLIAALGSFMVSGPVMALIETIWLAPLAVGAVLVPAAIIAILVWNSRPRRVVEPVTRDLRDVYR
jgi:hypothetical protein